MYAIGEKVFVIDKTLSFFKYDGLVIEQPSLKNQKYIVNVSCVGLFYLSKDQIAPIKMKVFL